MADRMSSEAVFVEPRFSCTPCGETFQSKSSFLRHGRRCPAKPSASPNSRRPARDSWECDICGVKFSRRYVLACHYRTHNGKKPYECASCGERFTWSVQLRLHAVKHPGEYVFKCPNCDQRFKTSSELQKHSIIHPRTGVASTLSRPSKILRKRPYRRSTASTKTYCVKCHKYFHKSHYLQNHVRAVHQGENLFECACCGAKFRWAMQLRVHATQHPGEALFKCSECDARFPTQSELTKHKKSHPKYRYDCSVCNEKFSLLKEILIHSKRHTRNKCYKCSDCDRCFAQPHLLKRHSAGHDPMRSGDPGDMYDEPGQRYHCGICRVCFSRSELLAAHMKQHLNPRPHQCEMCGKCFQRADNLRCHIRIHTGEKPYQCEHCQKSFKESGQLVKHRRIHTGEKPYMCESCGKAFTDSSKVKKHIRSMHSGPNRGKKTKPPKPAYTEPVLISEPSLKPSSSTVQYTTLTATLPANASDFATYSYGLCYDANSEITHIEETPGTSASSLFLTTGDGGRGRVQLFTTGSNVPNVDADVVREFFQQQEQILASTSGQLDHVGASEDVIIRQEIPLDEPIVSLLAPVGQTVTRVPLMVGVARNQKLSGAAPMPLDDVIDSASLMPTAELTRTQRPETSKTARKTTKRARNTASKTVKSTGTLAIPPIVPVVAPKKVISNLYDLLTSMVPESDDISCDQCEKKFGTKLLLLQHTSTHTGEKPFPCEFCTERFACYLKLVKHTVTHEEYDKKCYVCQKSFDVPAKLFKHTRYHLNQTQSKCKLCDQTFSQAISLEEHMRSAHDSADPHQCERCGKFFKLRANLDSHVRTHTGEKPYGPCEYCGKFFREMGQFKKHIRIHSGDRPYPCPYCSKAFVDSTKRKRHCKNTHKDMIDGV